VTQHPEAALAEIPAAVPGAARYFARREPTGSWVVRMVDTEGYSSVVDCCASGAGAHRSAARLQKRENLVVSKHKKVKA
jgi:hypothetical protein